MKNSKRILLFLENSRDKNGVLIPIEKRKLQDELLVFMSKGKFYDSLYLLRKRRAVNITFARSHNNSVKADLHLYSIASHKKRYEFKQDNAALFNKFQVYDLKKSRVIAKYNFVMDAREKVDALNQLAFWF